MYSCYHHRHLSDPSHRETFKYTYLVVLGVFAAHVQKLGDVVMLIRDSRRGVEVLMFNLGMAFILLPYGHSFD
jgi:hypothetical protein